MFSNGPLDFFYAAHNQMASTVMNMTISLTLGTKSINSNMPEAFTPGQCRSARMECVREEEGRMPKAEGGKDIKRRTRVTRVASGGSGVALGGLPCREGNSIISDPAVHPKALDWQAAFPEVFAQGGVSNVAPVECWAGTGQYGSSATRRAGAPSRVCPPG
jgi:hypothetical protein